MESIATLNGHSNGTHPYDATAIFPELASSFPEAQCNVSLKFCVRSLEFPEAALATGRGRTPDEAAANLAATITATRKALAPKIDEPVKPTTTLGNLLECGIKKAVNKGDMNLVTRLAKAAALVVSEAVQPGNRDGLWTVRSQAAGNEGTWYELEPLRNSCSCADQQKRLRAEQPGWCKHLLAYAFYNRLNA